MKTIKKHVKSKRYTFLGREADVEVFRFQSKFDGERVVAHRWVDNGELRLTHCKGDGRTPDFHKFNESIIPNGTSEDVLNYVNARLVQ